MARFGLMANHFPRQSKLKNNLYRAFASKQDRIPASMTELSRKAGLRAERLATGAS